MADNLETPVETTKEEKVELPIDGKTITPPATPTAEEKSESLFDIDLDEKVETNPTDKVKFGKDKWKDLDDDIYSDDEDLEFDSKSATVIEKALGRAKEYKQKANEYKSIAEANKTINEDPHIKYWAELHDSDDDSIVLVGEKQKYLNAGKSEEEALRLAQADVEELKGESEKLFSKRAKDIRLDLEGAITKRSKELHENISKTAQALNLSKAPNPELVSKAIEALSKQDNFLGLKYGGKNETAKKDFIKPVEAAIKDGSLISKIQSDPALLAEIGLLVYYKDKFSKAIEKKSANKVHEKDKLAKAPHSSGTPPLKSDIVVPDGNGLKDPGGFR